MGDNINVALNDTQVREVDLRCELAVRQYFDHYLNEVVPQREKALREHTYLMIEAHDAAEEAHGYVERRLNKAIWLVMGAAVAGSGGAVGALKLFGGLGV